MVTRTITKDLGGETDLLFGRSTDAQTRSGVNYNIPRIDKLHPVDTMTDLLVLDVSDPNLMFYNVMLLSFTTLGDNGGGIFWYDATRPQTAHDGKTIIKATGASINGCYIKVLPESDTQTNLRGLAVAINTTNKYVGKQVWDSTNLQPVWAAGPLAGDVWVDGVGTTLHTPV